MTESSRRADVGRVEKQPIRVRYSGFVVFAAQIVSLFTGLIFTLLLTRPMTDAEFGTWSFIQYLTALFVLPSALFPFWATRFLARGKEGAAKTALSANLMIAAVSIAVYLVFLTPLMAAFGVSSIYLFVYLLASLQILNLFLIAVQEACLQAVKPHAKGYGLVIEETVKVTVAIAVIVGLKQLFMGAMMGLILGAAAQVVFYLYVLRGELLQKARWSYLREWLKGSTAYTYNIVGSQIGGLLLTYILTYLAGTAALGNYQAAVTFSAVIGYASSLAFALYPKMLAQECPEDVASSFNTVIMLVLPMAAIALSMAQSLLEILKAAYATAAPVLMLLVVDALIVVIGSFYTQCLMGVEAFDMEGKIPLRQLVRSKIFKVFSLPYLQAAISLPTLYLVLTRVGFSNPVQAAVYMVAATIAGHVVSYAVLYALLHKSLKIKIAWASVAKYVLGALATAAVLLILPITTTLVATFGKVLVGVAIYTVLMYAVDGDARSLVKQILAEVFGGFKGN